MWENGNKGKEDVERRKGKGKKKGKNNKKEMLCVYRGMTHQGYGVTQRVCVCVCVCVREKMQRGETSIQGSVLIQSHQKKILITKNKCEGKNLCVTHNPV